MLFKPYMFAWVDQGSKHKCKTWESQAWRLALQTRMICFKDFFFNLMLSIKTFSKVSNFVALLLGNESSWANLCTHTHFVVCGIAFWHRGIQAGSLGHHWNFSRGLTIVGISVFSSERVWVERLIPGSAPPDGLTGEENPFYKMSSEGRGEPVVRGLGWACEGMFFRFSY